MISCGLGMHFNPWWIASLRNIHSNFAKKYCGTVSATTLDMFDVRLQTCLSQRSRWILGSRTFFSGVVRKIFPLWLYQGPPPTGFFIYLSKSYFPAESLFSGMTPIIRAVLSKNLGDLIADQMEIISNDVQYKPDGRWTIQYRHPSRYDPIHRNETTPYQVF